MVLPYHRSCRPLRAPSILFKNVILCIEITRLTSLSQSNSRFPSSRARQVFQLYTSNSLGTCLLITNLPLVGPASLLARFASATMPFRSDRSLSESKLSDGRNIRGIVLLTRALSASDEINRESKRGLSLITSFKKRFPKTFF